MLSIKYVGPCIWNNLPADICNISSIALSKETICSCINEKINNFVMCLLNSLVKGFSCFFPFYSDMNNLFVMTFSLLRDAKYTCFLFDQIRLLLLN